MDNDELQKKLILIVNDDYHILRLLEIYLTMEEFQVIMATNGRDALEVLEEILPDLIFLNKQMPVMDGYVALDRIREDTRTCDIPVIMHSADYPDFSNYRRNRFDDYFTCPFNLNEVVDAIRSLLQEREKNGRKSRKELCSRAKKLKKVQENYRRRLRDNIEAESKRYKWRVFAQQGEKNASDPVHNQTRINPMACMNELVIMLLLKEGKEVIRKLEERLVSEQGALATINEITSRMEDMFFQGITAAEREALHRMLGGLYLRRAYIVGKENGVENLKLAAEHLKSAGAIIPIPSTKERALKLENCLLSQKCCFRSFTR